MSRPFAHRRSPGAAEPGPPPNVPVRSISPGLQGRPSTSSRAGSSGGGGSRRVNREVSLHQEEYVPWDGEVGDV